MVYRLICFIGELLQNASSITTKWKKLLKYYLADVDDEVCDGSTFLILQNILVSARFAMFFRAPE